MITTTPNRVKKAGFWCDQADKQTQAMLDAIGADWDTEIPVDAGLDHLGLANTLLAIGAPRPRYATKARAVLVEYADFVFTEAEHVGKRAFSEDFNLKPVRRAYLVGHAEQRRKLLTEQWQKNKFNGETPQQRIIAEFVILMLSELPLHMRLIHGAKTLLNAVQMEFPGNHVNRFKQALKQALEANP